jgi:ribonuclease-3
MLIKSGSDTRDEITLKKKDLEREEKLAQIGRDLGIGQAIKLGIGEKKQRAGEEPKVLAETVEALIAAIYYDGGFEAAKETISKWFKI